jgi:hypothetical protein
MEIADVTLAARGQIVIPKEARDALGLKPDARFEPLDRQGRGRRLDHRAGLDRTAPAPAPSIGSLFVCAVVVAELGRYFTSAVGAARIMRAYARNAGPRERVAPDFLIGAHAMHQADALLTTDAGFFRNYFKGLTVVTPAPRR